MLYVCCYVLVVFVCSVSHCAVFFFIEAYLHNLSMDVKHRLTVYLIKCFINKALLT